jgi:hypothetical protein
VIISVFVTKIGSIFELLAIITRFRLALAG